VARELELWHPAFDIEGDLDFGIWKEIATVD
jgi:hypothetical protein